MNEADKRFWTVSMKWLAIGIVVYYLWYFKFFWVLFVGVPFVLTREVQLIIEYGLQPVLVYHAQWWVACISSMIFLVVFEYFTHYRHKRRDLNRGGQYEGRAVWVRGSNVGLIYDVWNFKNYIRWKLKNRRGRASRRRDSSRGSGTSRGIESTQSDRPTAEISENNCHEETETGWPDPFSIELGERTRTHYVVYFRRFLWQFFVPRSWDKLYVPRDMHVEASLFAFWLPRSRLVSSPDPTRPGRRIFRLERKMVEGVDHDPALYTKAARTSLGRSQALVKWAILSDAETIKVDYTHGMPIPGVEVPDEEFD